MEMICISSFGRFGKIKNLTINKVYNVKFTIDDKFLIINDLGKPQFVITENFTDYNKLKQLSEIYNI